MPSLPQPFDDHDGKLTCQPAESPEDSRGNGVHSLVNAAVWLVAGHALKERLAILADSLACLEVANHLTARAVCCGELIQGLRLDGDEF